MPAKHEADVAAGKNKLVPDVLTVVGRLDAVVLVGGTFCRPLVEEGMGDEDDGMLGILLALA